MVLKHLNQLQENIRLKGTSGELNGERLKQCLKGRVGQSNSCGPTWNQWAEEPQGAHVIRPSGRTFSCWTVSTHGQCWGSETPFLLRCWNRAPSGGTAGEVEPGVLQNSSRERRYQSWCVWQGRVQLCSCPPLRGADTSVLFSTSTGEASAGYFLDPKLGDRTE